MADLREEMLEEEINKLDDQMKTLAARMEEIVGVDCNFGACVFDPAMDDIEQKIEEVQKRKQALEQVLQTLESCDT